MLEACSISRATSNIVSAVVESCMGWPFSQRRIFSDIGSPPLAAGTR